VLPSAVTDAMGRQAPAELLGIHMNLLLAGLADGYPSPPPAGGTGGARRDHHLQDLRQRLPDRAEHAAADDRLRPAGLTRRTGGLLDHDTDSSYKISRAFLDGQPSGQLARDQILDKITPPHDHPR
jgi:hypothetical protein